MGAVEGTDGTAWTDSSLVRTPGHVLHSPVQILGDVVRTLEDASRTMVAPSEGKAGRRWGSRGGAG